MQLHLMTWVDVRTYLQKSKGIIIPLGSTEQHGPNGLLGTDVICPEVIAQKAAQDAEILVAPPFNVGCAQHHMAFAGTITLRPSTMIAALCDWVNSLAVHGFERFYFLNGHGGNISTANAAFAELYAAHSLDGEHQADAPICKLKNWWELPGVMKLCTSLYPTGHGSHATPSEVSLTFHAHPEAAQEVAMIPKIAPTGPFTDAADYRRHFPDGRIGSDPTQANSEDGEKILEMAAEGLRQSYGAFMDS